jgi:hypothetical protein
MLTYLTLTHPPSLLGLTPQVGFTRLAAHNAAQLGRARVAMQSIALNEILFSMDARVISAFTRVFDALLPAHDDGEVLVNGR